MANLWHFLFKSLSNLLDKQKKNSFFPSKVFAVSRYYAGMITHSTE